MSLSWSESLRTSLSPGRACLVNMQRGRAMAWKLAAAADSGTGQAPWESALAALDKGLAEMHGPQEARGGHNARHGAAGVTAVLSNHFVRYALVPENDALAGEEEQIAHARHCFVRTYGDVAESWELRLSPGAGGPQVASAVDAGLLAGLDRVVSAHGRQLVSIQPYLMAAFNRWRRELNGSLTWFVLAEDKRLCLAALQRDGWRDLVNLQTGDKWAAELPAQLARQRLLSGLDELPGKVCVFAFDEVAERHLKQAGEEVRGLHLPRLPEMPAAQAGYFKMAVNG